MLLIIKEATVIGCFFYLRQRASFTKVHKELDLIKMIIVQGEEGMRVKITIIFMLLITMILLAGCSKKGTEISNPGIVNQDNSQKDAQKESTEEVQKATMNDKQEDQKIDKINSKDLFKGNISDIEYAFLLWNFRDQVVSDLTYTLHDADGDKRNELLINVITDKEIGMHTQFIADSNDTLFHFQGYTPTGAAASSNFCTIKGYDTILWNTEFATKDVEESKYHQWTGSDWKEVKELDGISYDYKKTAKFNSPNLLNIELIGDQKSIMDSVDAYFKNRNNAHVAGESDLDGDGQIEKVYYVFKAGDDWYNCLRMKNTTENQSFRDHQDIYMTVIIADNTANGVVLRPVRVSYRGSKIEILQNSLFINGEKYKYTDKKSEFNNPCLQTALKSPGTYGGYDSKGNRTILSMLNMPYYDVEKMCQDVTFYEKDPLYISASIGKSRCTFEFMSVTDNKKLTAGSTAYKVHVDGWNQEGGGISIDRMPIIGDFGMGDSIGKLKSIMVPSTQWTPLLFGQDFLAHTSFYYRPSYENENVYFVQIWTDGEGKNSKVCAIHFDQAYDLDSKTKKVLGL